MTPLIGTKYFLIYWEKEDNFTITEADKVTGGLGELCKVKAGRKEYEGLLNGTGNTLCNTLIKSACGVNSVTALPCSEPNGQLAMRFYLV